MTSIKNQKNKENLGKLNGAESEIRLLKDEKTIFKEELEIAQKECKKLLS